LFFSPFSIRMALGMTYAGARGQTAVQMSHALRGASSDEALHVTFAEIMRKLNAAGGGRSEIAVENSLWGQDGAPLQPGFLDLLARYYGGVVNVVDFRHATEMARLTINRWVADKTRQKIRELIPVGGLDADTRLALVNAIYFKALWASQFRKTATRGEFFYLEGGDKAQTLLMHQHGLFRYLKASDYQAVDLDYRGGELSMLVLLPDQRDGLRDLERRLSPRMVSDCVAKMQLQNLEIFLPRFRMTWGTVDLRDQLRALGMELAFTRFQADFSGINGRQPPAEDSVFISAVFHQAFVEVNEEGTEAAAATAVGVTLSGLSAPPPDPIFRADHPFLLAILHRKSSAILFLGRMTDPTRES
jgi:serpin B